MRSDSLKKKAEILLCFCLLSLAQGFCVRASEIAWTNTMGGNWDVAVNWNPNQVPGSSDNAYVTNAGIYTVTYNTTATVSSLTVGEDSGLQTLSLEGGRLALSGTIILDHGSQLRLKGGTMEGGVITSTNGAALI